MSTWEERMADAARQRREAAEAERERLGHEEEERLEAEFPALPGEGPVLADPPYFLGYEHRGHRTHSHPWHGLGTITCSCGVLMGVVCYVPPDEPAPAPERCPVCTARGIPQG